MASTQQALHAKFGGSLELPGECGHRIYVFFRSVGWNEKGGFHFKKPPIPKKTAYGFYDMRPKPQGVVTHQLPLDSGRVLAVTRINHDQLAFFDKRRYAQDIAGFHSGRLGVVAAGVALGPLLGFSHAQVYEVGQ
jgi:hypothetical protein